MKHIRRTLALLLAAALVLALSIAAFADGTNTGSITINNAVNGKEYKIYRIFDLNSHNDDYSALNYTVNASWADFFKEGAAGLTYVTIDKDFGYVTWKTDASAAAAFAAAALQFAKDRNITNDGQQTASGSTVKFENLQLGYYLVESGLGTLCSLDTTLPNVTIKEKNSAPTVEKKVDGAACNDANIGDTVTFTTTINVTDGNPVAYVLHDQMSEGLSFDQNSVKVTVNGKDFTDYELVTSDLNDDCTFEIRFDDVTTGEVTSSILKPNDVVTVTYTAKVNDKAVIAGEGNPNETWLKYDNTGKTTSSKTRTYVWDMKVVKFTMKNNEEGPEEVKLEGAQFVLYRLNGSTKEYVVANSNNKVTGWTENTYDSSESTKSTVFTTPADGTFTISGLDSGTYYLEEIKAPAGYNMLKEAVKVDIKATTNSEAGTMTAAVKYGSSEGDVKVENQTGTELPSTGGVGTTIFYIIGSLLAAGAVILLVTRKRMGKPEE